LSESAIPIVIASPSSRSIPRILPAAVRLSRRRSGEVQFLALVLAGCPLARRAPPARLERRPAHRMARRRRLAGVTGAPAREEPERARQLRARRRELVDEPG